MTKKLILLCLIAVGISITNAQQTKKNAIINGIIKNFDGNEPIILRNNLVILPDEMFKAHLDSGGYFKFIVPVTGLSSYWLSLQSPDGIPILINNGDSIFINYRIDKMKSFPEDLKNVEYEGTGNDKNKSFYILYRNRYSIQDSVYQKYIRTDDPSKYKLYCYENYEIEKKRIITELKAKKQNRQFKEFALLDNKLFWIEMLFQYSIRPSEKFKGQVEEYMSYLNSIGYFSFIKELMPEITIDDYKSNSYGSFIRNYYNYYNATNLQYKTLSSDIDRINYISKSIHGPLNDLLLTFYIYNYLHCDTENQMRDIINTYIKNKRFKEILLENIYKH